MNEKLMRLYARRDVIWNLYGAAHESKDHMSMRQMWAWLDQLDREIHETRNALKH